MRRREFLGASMLPLALAGCEKATSEIEGGFVGQQHQRGHLLRARASSDGQAGWPAPAITRRTRVVIAGGGVAGLAAARALLQRGMDDFVLLELEDAAGGNSRGALLGGMACPLGAHYLPVPGDDAPEVQDLLEELGLRQRVAGRWQYDERYLCHSPQERLFIDGHWQEGLLPMQDVGAATLAEYQRFATLVDEAARTGKYRIPISNVPPAQVERALDAITFLVWLDQHQLVSQPLRWYLDYCCRDDYGAGIDSVSAWAGLHYFASRHGFSVAGDELGAAESGLLTWPEGNGWLTQRLAQPLGGRLLTAQVVVRIAASRHGVEVDAFNPVTGTTERWLAEHCISCLPLFVAARVVENPPPALQQAAGQLRYSPWLVANIHINAALHDPPGAAPSWDNVLYAPQDKGGGLGYVDASHQSLRAVRGATVLTHYRALGLNPDARKELYQQPWSHWRDTLLAELSAPHPDIAAKISRIELMRYGHAMSTPVPGIRSSAALQALQKPLPAPWQRLQFAHSDLSGYSVFEEAFTHGHRRALAWAKAAS